MGVLAQPAGGSLVPQDRRASLSGGVQRADRRRALVLGRDGCQPPATGEERHNCWFSEVGMGRP